MLAPLLSPDLPAVPWITTWSDEHRYEVRPCRWAGGRPAVWQPHNPGSGTPLFKVRHMVRARQAIARQLCGVCGRFVTEGDRWIVPIGAIVIVNGAEACALQEPFVHTRCMAHALELCPALMPAFDRTKQGPVPLTVDWFAETFSATGAVVNQEFGTAVPAGNNVVTALAVCLRRHHFQRLFPHGIIRMMQR